MADIEPPCNRGKSSEKTSKARNDRCVQGTNDSSVLSKCSMAKMHYFEDSFLQHFACKSTRRAPLIHRGYYIRAMAVQRCFLLFLKNSTGRKRQVISLGAGFDSSYFRLKDENLISSDDVVYIEIDFLPLCNRKANLIRQNRSLCDILDLDAHGANLHHSPEIVIDTPGYKLLGVDLSNIPLLDACLSSMSVNLDLPTMLLSEVVLPYMGARISNNLVKWACDSFSNSFFVSYEQVHPFDAFGQVMMKHFASLGSPLKYIERYPDEAAIHSRYKSVGGWPQVRVLNMNDFFTNIIGSSERHRIKTIECFDEHEEWNRKCAHYVIVAAASGELEKIPEFFVEGAFNDVIILPETKPRTLSLRFTETTPQTFQRFGHTSSKISDKTGKEFAVVVGGFGNFDGRHTRKACIDIVSLDDLTLVPNVEVSGLEVVADRLFHTTTVIKNDALIVFGGRQSPSKPFADPVSISIGSISTNDSNPFRVEATPLPTSGDAPLPRWRHTATLVNQGDADSSLFVYGGKVSYSAVTNESHLLHLGSGVWSKISMHPDPLPKSCSHSADVWNNDVVVYGGLNEDFLPQSTILLLNTCNRTYSELSPVQGLLFPRFGHSSHILGNRLIVVGGINDSSSVPGVGVFNLETLEVTEFTCPSSLDNRLLMMRNHQSFNRTSEDGQEEVVVVGGGGNCFSFGTHFNADFFSFALPL